jgi:ATP-dependent protease ClpP protease subunit
MILKILYITIFLIFLYFFIFIVYGIYVYKKIKSYEKKNKTKVIFICDKYWKDRFFSLIKLFFYNKYICETDDYYIIRNILIDCEHNNIKKLDIILETYGGIAIYNNKLINFLLEFKENGGEINIHIPFYAQSAGTMIALCGNVIYMDNYAIMSPTDPIINIDGNNISIDALNKLFNIKKSNKSLNNILSDDLFLKTIDYKKIYDENLELLGRILINKKKLVEIFGSGKYSHDRIFTKNFLLEQGLNIKDENNDIVKIYLYLSKLF